MENNEILKSWELIKMFENGVERFLDISVCIKLVELIRETLNNSTDI